MSSRFALFVAAVAVAGCKQDVEQLDPGAIKAGVGVARYMAERADEEHKGTVAQQRELDRKIAEAQQLIDRGDLDRAEVALQGVFWRPVSPGSNVDREFVRQYDERREALLRIVEGRRGVRPK